MKSVINCFLIIVIGLFPFYDRLYAEDLVEWQRPNPPPLWWTNFAEWKKGNPDKANWVMGESGRVSPDKGYEEARKNAEKKLENLPYYPVFAQDSFSRYYKDGTREDFHLFETRQKIIPPLLPPEPPTKPVSWKRGLGAMVFHGGEGNEFQLVPAILFAGSVGSYFYFDSQYKENWSKYESSSNLSDGKRYHNSATQSMNYINDSIKAGGIIWVANVIYSFIQDNKDVGKPKKFSPITTYIIPQPDGGIVLLSYSF